MTVKGLGNMVFITDYFHSCFQCMKKKHYYVSTKLFNYLKFS